MTKRERKPNSQPPVLDTLPIAKQWQPTGHCCFCLEPLEALQPGGLNPRHIASKVFYGRCMNALLAKGTHE